MPVERAVAVVIHREQLLVIHRIRDGRSYSVLPGGGVEAGETAEEAVLRELAEETSLIGTVERQLGTVERQLGTVERQLGTVERQLGTTDDGSRPASYFLITIPDPDAPLVLGGPETARQSDTNSYRPGWIDRRRLAEHNLQPEAVRPLIAGLFG